MFEEYLDEALRRVEGALACSLMGFDGLPVEARSRPGCSLDAATLGTELAGHFLGMMRTSQTLKLGPLAELSLRTGDLWLVARLLDENYFIVLFLDPGGNVGKAHYLLRHLAPLLRKEL